MHSVKNENKIRAGKIQDSGTYRYNQKRNKLNMSIMQRLNDAGDPFDCLNILSTRDRVD